MNLGEIAEIKRGVRVVRSQLSGETGFPVYQNSMTPLGYNPESNCPGDTTFVIAAGAAGEVGYCANDFWAADDCYYFVCLDVLQSRFLYYFLLTQKTALLSQVRKASVPRLSRLAIEKLRIPLPPVEDQTRIVSILDRFESLCDDITSGIPAEIDARQKQYTYYRDKLLSFKGRKANE